MGKAAIEFDQLPKNVVEYIKELENQVFGDIQKPVIMLRDSLKKQIESISAVLNRSSVVDLSDSDDKTWDRVLKLSTDSKKIVENLIFLEGIIAPKVVEEKVAEEGTAESYVRLKKPTIK
jgi:hypothetical protein